MKYLLILAIALTASHLQAEDRKIIGTFESVPLEFFTKGLPDSVSAKHKEMLEKTKQTVVITEKDMTLNTTFGGGGIYMTYTTQGDFILGKTKLGEVEMFYPIYIKDEDTLFIAGQKLVRKKDTSK